MTSPSASAYMGRLADLAVVSPAYSPVTDWCNTYTYNLKLMTLPLPQPFLVAVIPARYGGPYMSATIAILSYIQILLDNNAYDPYNSTAPFTDFMIECATERLAVTASRL